MLCDLAQFLMFEAARTADQTALFTGHEPVAVEQLSLALMLFDDVDELEESGGDADVIFLNEYTPRELALELGLK